MMFQYLTLPNKMNHNFPFHVKTNKINIINDNSETENYPHHLENEINEKYFDLTTGFNLVPGLWLAS